MSAASRDEGKRLRELPCCTSAVAAHTLQTGLCPRASAGDFLQVATNVFALGDVPTLASAIGLVVSPAGAATGGSGGGTSTPVTPGAKKVDRTSLLTVPRSLRIRRARKGIRFTVKVPADGARVTATLSARRVGRIASTRRSGVRAGALRLRLKPTHAAGRKLSRRRCCSLVFATCATMTSPPTGGTRTGSIGEA